jgi:subtilisin family serine protease
MRRHTFALAASALLLALNAQSATYVLNAAQWGGNEDAAVARAGGKVKLRNSGAGVAIVESDNPGFLATVGIAGQLDRVVRWTDPVAMRAMPAAVNPANDTYYATVQWAPQSVEAPAAWAAGYTGRGVRVAVIDGGIYAPHPDLAGAIDVAASRSFVEPEDGANNACRTRFDCDEDPSNFWHGTHVAGIIGARDNTRGVVGIAPEATIVGVKALHDGSGSFAAVISAILYAAGEGRADVINMSLGALLDKHDPGVWELRNALRKATKEASKTALVVASAGNDALSLDGNSLVVLPAESADVMAISATGPLGFGHGATNFTRFASYSNYGHSLVDVAGPGGDFAYPLEDLCTKALPAAGASITRPCWVFDMVLSTNFGGGYAWAAGTSMSAPAVAAVAALVKQKKPRIEPTELRRHLERTATDMGRNSDAFYGEGFINARRAVSN